jgi:hypothetical protein
MKAVAYRNADAQGGAWVTYPVTFNATQMTIYNDNAGGVELAVSFDGGTTVHKTIAAGRDYTWTNPNGLALSTLGVACRSLGAACAKRLEVFGKEY